MSRASPSPAHTHTHLPDPVKSAIRDFNAALARSNLHISSLVLEHAPIHTNTTTTTTTHPDRLYPPDPLLLVLNSDDAARAKFSLRSVDPRSSSYYPLRPPADLLVQPPLLPDPLPQPLHPLPQQQIPQPKLLPTPSSLLDSLPLPPPTALKRSSFGTIPPSTPELPFKRSRSNPDTSSFLSRQRPLSMPALRSSPAPFWGTVLTPPPITTSLPPPNTNTNIHITTTIPAASSANPRDDPRFLPLLQDTLSKKLASNTNIIPANPNITSASNAPPAKLQPSPLVTHIRSQPVAAGAASGSVININTPPFRINTTTSPSAPHLPYRTTTTAPSVSHGGSVGVGRPRTSLPGLELGTPIRYSATTSSGGGVIGSTTMRGAAGGTASTTTSAGAFSCSHCEAAFKRRSDMNRHVRVVHQRLRPFECPTCKQRFGEKGNMQKHIRMVHQNIRGFHCQYCGASFGQRGNCESHIRSVHEKRPGKYECSLCSRAFARKAHLLDHYASDHPGIPAPSARARPRAPIPPTYHPTNNNNSLTNINNNNNNNNNNTTFLPAPPAAQAGRISNRLPLFGGGVAVGGPRSNVTQQKQEQHIINTIIPPPTTTSASASNSNTTTTTTTLQRGSTQLPPPPITRASVSLPSLAAGTSNNNNNSGWTIQRPNTTNNTRAGGSSAGDAAERRKTGDEAEGGAR